jgi:hypothetical protein
MPVITKPNQHFDVTTYTGTGSAGQVQTNSGSMQPDFVWIKNRSSTGGHGLWDSVRGATKYLSSQNTDAEGTSAVGVTSFNSNGFTVGSDSWTGGNAATYVAWQWKAGGTAVTNTAGSVTSQVSVNTTAGFSIVSYASGAAGQKTVGHGLGVTPSMIITKSRDDANYNWSIYHSSVIDTTSKFLRLNTTDAIVTSSTIWGAALPTSTVFGITSDNGVPANNNCIAYCWAPVAGYSAFGKYTGNGSTDGPFIYTGFRPEFVLVKASSNSTASTVWNIWDGARSRSNAALLELYPNSNIAEQTDSNGADILSNGFKPRRNSEYANSSGWTYIYAAFAEAPFKYANAR